MTGKTLGDYELIRELGRGGMGVVWLAEHKRLRNKYAIKILPEELKNDEQFIQRFHVEAGVMARLDHPNIVRVHYMGREDDTYYIVMEYIHDDDGETRTLEDFIRERKDLPQKEARDILLQVCDGLVYAHNYKDDQIREGVIHRDIKPGNVFIRNGREVKISDFGLARIVGNEYLSSRIHESISISIAGQGFAEKAEASVTLTGGKTSAQQGIKDALFPGTLSGEKTGEPKKKYQKTSTGALLGTYDYMAPEQRRGEEADKRSDIYSLGVLIYNTITGRKPEGRYPSVKKTRPGFPGGWDAIIDRCLEQEPGDRFQRMSDIRMRIASIGKTNVKKVGIYVSAVLLIACLAGFLFLGKKEPLPPPEPSSGKIAALPPTPVPLPPKTPAPVPTPSPRPRENTPPPPAPVMIPKPVKTAEPPPVPENTPIPKPEVTPEPTKTPPPPRTSTPLPSPKAETTSVPPPPFPGGPSLKWRNPPKTELNWREGQELLVEYSGESPGSSPSHYFVQLNEGKWDRSTSTRWKVPLLTEGPHTLRVQMEDLQGNKSNTPRL